MCKERRFWMKFNTKCVQNMYKSISLLLGLFLFSYCNTPDPEFKRIITEEYPPLHEAIENRDGATLLEFTSHPDSLIRAHAWQALIQTNVEDWDLHIQKVLEANSDEAWASLWLKELDDKKIEYFNMLWQQNPRYKKGLAGLFVYHGDEETFQLLMNEPLSGDKELDHSVAYAIGSRSRTIDLSPEQEIALVDKALKTKDDKLTRGYLHGYSREVYRSEKKMSTEALEHMLYLWENYYPNGTEGNQMIVRLLTEKYTDKVIQHFPIERYSHMNVQLAIEIANAVGRTETTEFTPVILNTLLDHRNSNVRIAALYAIRNHEEVAERLFSDIMNKVALVEHRDAYLRMVAFNTILTPGRYREEAIHAAGDDPYLISQKYEFLDKTDSKEDVFEMMLEDLKHENRLNRFFAAEVLSSWWMEQGEEFIASTKDDVKVVISNLLEERDRSITIALLGMFYNEQLFGEDDFPEIEQILENYTLPADVEVLQSFSSFLYERYQEKAESLIQEWAAEGNTALNSWLRREGWDISEGEAEPPVFRTPDWDKLVKLGPNPYIVIETAKGDITIKLDVLTAPATISGMQSLIKARAYNGVPFHRVVPNFVVQGGDVESQNGYGGPDYTVPTEASAAMYERGKVGIASAGSDTEGSQYFIMHQWAPHLNGRYTIIGEVTEGMDVVDRIVQGDVVELLRWY